MRVPTTKKLWEEIESRIKAMFQRRLDEEITVTNYNLTPAAVSGQVYRMFFNEQEEVLMTQLGQRFFKKGTLNEEKNVELPCFKGHKNPLEPTPPPELRKPFNLTVKITISGKMVPYSWDGYQNPCKPPHADVDIADRVQRMVDASSQLSFERDSFIGGIKHLYDQVPTANQFLKEWPAGEEFISSEIMDRIRAKSGPREKPETVLDEGKLTDLNAALLRAKILK